MSAFRRRYQEANFVVTCLQGHTLEQLLGVIDADNPDRGDHHPIVVYLKVSDFPWQRFFVEFGGGVWEEVEAIDENEEGDGVRFADYASKFGLAGRKIASVACLDCKIRIVTDSTGTFSMTSSDNEDAITEVSFDVNLQNTQGI